MKNTSNMSEDFHNKFLLYLGVSMHGTVSTACHQLLDVIVYSARLSNFRASFDKKNAIIRDLPFVMIN